MNIVDLIKDQLSGEMIGSLSTLLGKDQATATKAVTGAVPALLSVLAGLAKSPGGIEKILSGLRTFDATSIANVVSALRSGNAAPIQQKGGELLGSLLGGNTERASVCAFKVFQPRFRIDQDLVEHIVALGAGSDLQPFQRQAA